jgi:uncharacterized membrane protein YeaQ/YmgE (transglycosylase-associated protein family)
VALWLLIIPWIVLSLLIGAWADRKGYNRVGFFFLALVVSPILGAIIVACLVDRLEKPKGLK